MIVSYEPIEPHDKLFCLIFTDTCIGKGESFPDISRPILSSIEKIAFYHKSFDDILKSHTFAISFWNHAIINGFHDCHLLEWIFSGIRMIAIHHDGRIPDSSHPLRIFPEIFRGIIRTAGTSSENPMGKRVSGAIEEDILDRIMAWRL